MLRRCSIITTSSSRIPRSTRKVGFSHRLVVLQVDLILFFCALQRMSESAIHNFSRCVVSRPVNQIFLIFLASSNQYVVYLQRPALCLGPVKVLISKSSLCLVLFWLELRLVPGHLWERLVQIGRALRSVSTNEIIVVIPVETSSLILGHHELCH